MDSLGPQGITSQDSIQTPSTTPSKDAGQVAQTMAKEVKSKLVDSAKILPQKPANVEKKNLSIKLPTGEITKAATAFCLGKAIRKRKEEREKEKESDEREEESQEEERELEKEYTPEEILQLLKELSISDQDIEEIAQQYDLPKETLLKSIDQIKRGGRKLIGEIKKNSINLNDLLQLALKKV